MKLPYTPLQHATFHAEESSPPPESLAGMPVVCCSLHSQLAPVCAGIGDGVRVAYLQLPGGALPVSLSDAVRALKARGLLEAAVAVGACIDGDVHCVSTASALAWAKGAGFDVAVCGIGPGIVGTGTALGHGGACCGRGGQRRVGARRQPVVAARVSEADERERHRGLSHHTEAVLALCLGEVTVADEADAEGWRTRRATAFRSRTWAAGRTRIPPSSPPPSPPVASRAA